MGKPKEKPKVVLPKAADVEMAKPFVAKLSKAKARLAKVVEKLGADAKTERPRGEPVELLAMPPMRAVLRLAMPTTLVMLLGTATNVLYTFYVSRLGSDAIAAVSLVFPITLLATTAMTGGLGGGAASGIARAIGAGHRQRAAEVAEHAIALAVFA